jgi:threonine aldolase
VYCHETAHIVTDECGAPEFFTGGAKMIGLPAADGSGLVTSFATSKAEVEEFLTAATRCN